MQQLKQLYRQMFGKLTPIEMAAQELYEAEVSKLRAQSALEYSASMVDYHTSRIERLKSYLASQTEL